MTTNMPEISISLNREVIGLSLFVRLVYQIECSNRLRGKESEVSLDVSAWVDDPKLKLTPLKEYAHVGNAMLARLDSRYRIHQVEQTEKSVLRLHFIEVGIEHLATDGDSQHLGEFHRAAIEAWLAYARAIREGGFDGNRYWCT